MNIQITEVNGELICMKYDHKEPITTVIMEDQMPIRDRFLCSKCMKINRAVVRIIGLDQVKEMINDKLKSKGKKNNKMRQENISILKQFQQKMKSIQTSFTKFIEESLRISEQWLKEYEKVEEDNQLMSLIKGLESLNEQQINNDEEYIRKINESYFTKISLVFKQRSIIDEIQNSYDLLKQVTVKNNQQQQQQGNVQEQKLVQENYKQNISQVSLIKSVKQNECCYAIAFNKDSSIMVATCKFDLKVWKFNQGQLTEQKRLTEHTNYVGCIVFSKKIDWFASGSDDKTIIVWKSLSNGEWMNYKAQTKHTDWIGCLILTSKEDELISSSGDATIIVWNVNFETNQIQFSYTLEKKHNSAIRSISLNESETKLVSCSEDKKIILWNKGNDNKWKYQNEILNDDYGYRLCFISEKIITWQQYRKGITHIFEIVNDQLIRRPEFNIKLNQESGDSSLFPTIYYKRREIVIQKHNKYVYLLKKQENGSLKLVSDPIDCIHHYNFGTLTPDGEYLIVFNHDSYEFRVHKIMYQ